MHPEFPEDVQLVTVGEELLLRIQSQ